MSISLNQSESTVTSNPDIVTVDSAGVSLRKLVSESESYSYYRLNGGKVTITELLHLDNLSSSIYFAGGADLSLARVEICDTNDHLTIEGDVTIGNLYMVGASSDLYIVVNSVSSPHLKVNGDLTIATSANLEHKDVHQKRGIIYADNLNLNGDYNTFSQLVIGEFKSACYLYLGTGEEVGDVGIGSSNWIAGGVVNNTGLLEIYNTDVKAGLWPTIIGSLEGEGSLSLFLSDLFVYHDVTLTSLEIDSRSNITVYGDLVVKDSARTEGAASDSGGYGTESTIIAENIHLSSEGESSLGFFQASGEIVCQGDLKTCYGGDLGTKSSSAAKMTCAGTYTSISGSLSLTDANAVSTIGQLNTSGQVYVAGSLILSGSETNIIKGALTVEGDLTTHGAITTGGGYALSHIYMNENSVFTIGGKVDLSVGVYNLTLMAKNLVVNYDISKTSPVISTGILTYAESLNVTISDSILAGLNLSDGESYIFATAKYVGAEELDDSDLQLNGKTSTYISEENGQSYTLSLDVENQMLSVLLTATGDLPVLTEWISTDGIWDATTSDWLSSSLPTASSTIYFSGNGSTSVQLDGAKTVNIVNISGADYTFTGDSLTTTSMNVDAPSLSLENDVTVTGSLKAAAADIVNDGTLSVGNGSDLQSLSGSGSFVLLANATASVDALSQAAVTIQSGAKLLLGSADVSLASLNNAGSLTTTGSLSLTTAATTTGGDVSVGSLAIVTGS
ncbi:MAG: hypothetical protein SNJ29_16600, partial [Rikenellaceae bacterium]